MAGLDLNAVWEVVLSLCLEKSYASEQSIAAKLGVSRTPVREALRHLQEEGLITRQRPAGIRLKQPTAEEMLATYDVRAVLEGLACRLLAESRNRSVLPNLKEINREMEALGEKNQPEIIKKEIAFHQTIIENCGNHIVNNFINKLHIVTTSFLVMNSAFVTTTPEKPVTYTHARVIKGLEFGPPEKAEEVMRRHIEETKQDIMECISRVEPSQLYNPLKTAVNGYFEKTAVSAV